MKKVYSCNLHLSNLMHSFTLNLVHISRKYLLTKVFSMCEKIFYLFICYEQISDLTLVSLLFFWAYLILSTNNGTFIILVPVQVS